MGAVLPLQHMHSLPHEARELLGETGCCSFLSKKLNVSILFTKGRNSEKNAHF